jgi:hypothetical protein
MRLVCGTPDWMRKYSELCGDRQLGYEPWPSRLTVFIAEGKELVAGVMVYDTTGPFLFFEHLVTNETASLRARYRAVNLLVEECLSMCRHLGKLPQVMVQHVGIKRILEKHGLVAPGAFCMTCHFANLEKSNDQQEPFAAAKHPRKLADSTLTEPAPPGHPAGDLGIYDSVLGGSAKRGAAAAADLR